MGDSGPALAGLATLFDNPEGYNILPYKHNHSRDGKYRYTGFFIPAHEFALSPEYLDSRGVTDSDRFKKFYEERRAKLSGADLVDYCAERCFIPEEALLKQGDNMFNADILSQRLTDLKVHKIGNPIKKVSLIWDKVLSPDGNELLEKVKVIESPNSKILIIEPPLIDKDGEPFKNLYVAGIDSIDMGKNDSTTNKTASDFCIVIKKRMFGLSEPQYVAMYKDRPDDIRTAYDNAMKLLAWYNCKALLEYSKISIQTYFKEKKKHHLFMKRPKFAISGGRSNNSLIGVPATENVIKHGLELIGRFVEDYGDRIDFEEMIDQLLNYSYTEKKKYDIIAALGMCEIADEELMGINPTKEQIFNNSNWRDYGYYIDQYGYKRKGVINKSDHGF